MLIHTTLVGNNPVTGKPTHVNARSTPSDHLVRSTVKRIRRNYPVQFDETKTEFENHVAAMQAYCKVNGYVDTTWVHNQETVTMYRFTEVLQHNWFHMHKPGVQLAPAPQSVVTS